MLRCTEVSQQSVASGHEPPRRFVAVMSAVPSIGDAEHGKPGADALYPPKLLGASCRRHGLKVVRLAPPPASTYRALLI